MIEDQLQDEIVIGQGLLDEKSEIEINRDEEIKF